MFKILIWEKKKKKQDGRSECGELEKKDKKKNFKCRKLLEKEKNTFCITKRMLVVPILLNKQKVSL